MKPATDVPLNPDWESAWTSRVRSAVLGVEAAVPLRYKGAPAFRGIGFSAQMTRSDALVVTPFLLAVARRLMLRLCPFGVL
jgi:hypothetical protein